MPHDILLVDDDPGTIQLIFGILADDATIRFATNGEDAVRLARVASPDLILLDAEMPGLSGLETCRLLRSEAALSDVPILFVTAHRDESIEVEGFQAGADDFIYKPINPRLLLARVQRQLRVKRMSDALRDNASIDALTGVANRRRFDELLAGEWRRARGARDPLALALLDVDCFSLFTDEYGHPAGEVCLRSIASALGKACLHPGDLVAHLGGGRFALLLPLTPSGGALRVARRALEAVESMRIPHAASLVAPFVTLSAGVACFGETSGYWRAASEPVTPGGSNDPPVQGLSDAASAALNQAKRAGGAQAYLVDLRESSTGELLGDLASAQCVKIRKRA